MFAHTSVSLTKLSCGMAGRTSYSVFGIDYSSNKYLNTYFLPNVVGVRDMVMKNAKVLLALHQEVT